MLFDKTSFLAAVLEKKRITTHKNASILLILILFFFIAKRVEKLKEFSLSLWPGVTLLQLQQRVVAHRLSAACFRPVLSLSAGGVRSWSYQPSAVTLMSTIQAAQEYFLCRPTS